MKTIKLFTYAVFALFLGLASCSTDAEDGMDGAMGAQGPAGQDGTDGQDGQDGNANVISVTFDAYNVSVGANAFDIPEITEDVYNDGVVLGYTTVAGNDFWETIPVVIGTEVRLDFDRIYLGGLSLVSDFDQTLDFRFIIIEGTPGTRAMQMSGKELLNYYEEQGADFSSYESAAAFFDL